MVVAMRPKRLLGPMNWTASRQISSDSRFINYAFIGIDRPCLAIVLSVFRTVFKINSIEPAPKKIRLSLPRLSNSKDFVLLWYGPITPSRTDGEVPRLIVWFCELRADGNLGGWYSDEVAMTFLGQLRVGSIWRGGVSLEQAAFEERHFHVNYSEWNWENTVSISDRGSSLIPYGNYAMRFPNADRSRLLQFPSAGGMLLLPCMEFFARCYARTGEVNRILMTYNAAEASERLMLAEPVDAISGKWPVWVPPNVALGDAHLLAQLRYDTNAGSKVKKLSAKLDSQLRGNKQSHAFLPIGPWFYGPAQLRVEGVPLDNGNFLGLRVVGYSLPEKPAVHAFYLRREQDAEGETGSHPYPRREIKEVPDSEVASVDPMRSADRDTDITLLKDPAIAILGDAAPIVTEAVTKDRNGRTIRTPSAPSSTVAPGEASGTGKGIGELRANTDVMMAASEGAVRDLWHGLVYLQKVNSTLIDSVSWYTSDQRFKGPPALPNACVPLPNLEVSAAEEEIKKTNAWLNRNGLPFARSTFIFRVETPQFAGYIFEVVRARRNIILEDGSTELKEESYRGLVAIPASNEDFESWLDTVCYAISLKRGMMKDVSRQIRKYVAHGDYYKRSTRDGDTLPGHATAFNALTRLGITDLKYSYEEPE